MGYKVFVPNEMRCAMKVKMIVLTAFISSVLAIPAVASVGHDGGVPVLEDGISSSQMISNGNENRYTVPIDKPTTLTVTSEHYAGSSSRGNYLKAVLYDASGEMVAAASDPDGHFSLVRSLEPGDYQLMVTGSTTMGGAHESRNIYQLHTQYQ